MVANGLLVAFAHVGTASVTTDKEPALASGKRANLPDICNDSEVRLKMHPPSFGPVTSLAKLHGKVRIRKFCPLPRSISWDIPRLAEISDQGCRDV